MILKKSIHIKVGKLGVYYFPKGCYYYTGSAMNGLESRIRRHLSNHKKLHWHIDYLLNNPFVEIMKILTIPDNTKNECGINQVITSIQEMKVIVPGFGSSDCKSGCRSHLLFFGNKAGNANHLVWKRLKAITGRFKAVEFPISQSPHPN